MSESADRPTFVATDVEQMVLGACLEYERLTAQFVAEGLRDTHFFSDHHRVIWRRLVQALREELGPTYSAVRMLLFQHGEMDEVGQSYLLRLTSGMPVLGDANIRAFTKRLVECAVGRETLVVLKRACAELEARPADLPDGFFSRTEGSLRSLSAQLAGRRLPDHISHVSEVMEEVRAALLAGPPEFVDTPWSVLNSMLGGGFAPGELAFLGARPGLGKTAAALEIARRAGKRGSSVFVVSREMLKVAIGMRMLSQEGPVNATTLRKRDLSPQHWSTIDLAIEQLQALPIFITHAELDINEIRRLAGIFADEGPLGLVIVDYLQLIDAPAGIKERRLQVEAVSAGLKRLTLDLQVPVLCLSSLSRPPQDNKRPTLASLRESGNLEHDADTVIFLHRPDEMQPETEVVVAKSRNGRTGLVTLHFRGEYLRFEENVGAGHGA